MKGIWMAIVGFFRSLFGSDQPTVPAVAQPAPAETPMASNKYAFLVGINKYVSLPGNDLQGCVNDVNNMWSLLTTSYGFDPDNIRMVCDERATKQAILDGLKWLVKDTAPGDELVFHYSGHGAQIRDTNGDELDDHMTEILCPTDLDWDDPLTDDMLAELFKQIAEGSFLTMISDSCHSGTQDRGAIGPNNPHPSKAKCIVPPLDIAVRGMTKRKLGKRSIGVVQGTARGAGDVHYFEQRHMLISGCRDDQTSADAYVDGKYQGAMTASLMKSIKDSPDSPWLKVHEGMLAWLKGQYAQVPQASGPHDRIDVRKPFGKA
jgi:hypothetical protein